MDGASYIIFFFYIKDHYLYGVFDRFRCNKTICFLTYYFNLIQPIMYLKLRPLTRTASVDSQKNGFHATNGHRHRRRLNFCITLVVTARQ